MGPRDDDWVRASRKARCWRREGTFDLTGFCEALSWTLAAFLRPQVREASNEDKSETRARKVRCFVVPCGYGEEETIAAAFSIIR